MSNFEIQWKALKDRKDEDDPDVPTITKALPIIKWTEALTEVCYLLEVSWQMCHAWITNWTVARAILTMSRRRSTRDERTHGRDAHEPLLART